MGQEVIARVPITVWQGDPQKHGIVDLEVNWDLGYVILCWPDGPTVWIGNPQCEVLETALRAARKRQ